MSNKRSIWFALLLAVLLFISNFFYLPYYVSRPGMAKELSPIIEVEGGYDESGSLMLTTIRMGRANIYSYVIAKYSDYQYIYHLNEIRAEDETDEEYTTRQLHMMDSSKANAIEVAYKKAGLPVDYKYNGIYVLQVVSDMPAEGKIHIGDHIIEIDGHRFQSSQEFIDYVSNKQAGETVTLTVNRREGRENISIPLKSFEEDSERVGIGISLVDDKEIIVEPEVKMQTDEIGGPSAGLMFSIEIYNQLVKEDLTKGYDIAGTGTISPDGSVGRIGGIEQKVVAADKAGADIFLAPHEEGAKESNYQAALKTAKDIDSAMKIVPITDFDDAIEYLESLEPKTS